MTTENQGTVNDTVEVTGLLSALPPLVDGSRDGEEPGCFELRVRAAGKTYRVVIMRDAFKGNGYTRGIFDEQGLPLARVPIEDSMRSQEVAIISALQQIIDQAYGFDWNDEGAHDAA